MASSGERVSPSASKMLLSAAFSLLLAQLCVAENVFSYSEPHSVRRRDVSTSTASPIQMSNEARMPKIQWDPQWEFPDNKTLKEHNILNTTEDHHVYYNSSYVVDLEITEKEWVHMDAIKDVQVNTMLSDSHRRAATVKLSFEFPFYGHLVRNVTIATGGFLYTGDYVHAWLTATQYVAPLMANFDTSVSNDSFVKYHDNGTAFTVQWDKVHLKDRPQIGEFTFQVTLHQNGDIVFAYLQIPVKIEDIDDESHPVKIGVSDAYIVDRNIFFVRKKTIYEYHRVQFTKNDIVNSTVIYLRALPTCSTLKDCATCTTAHIGFECGWCPSVERCSDGVDRKRQDWLAKECHMINNTAPNQCSASERVFTPTSAPSYELPAQAPAIGIQHEPEETPGSYLAVAFAVMLACLVLVFVVWATYAYFNPHSSSGQFLIRYRPSQWQWRRGEARYMAATIHM